MCKHRTWRCKTNSRPDKQPCNGNYDEIIECDEVKDSKGKVLVGECTEKLVEDTQDSEDWECEKCDDGESYGY